MGSEQFIYFNGMAYIRRVFRSGRRVTRMVGIRQPGTADAAGFAYREYNRR